MMECIEQINQMYEDSKNNVKNYVPMVEKSVLFPYNQKELLETVKSLDTMSDEEAFTLLKNDYSIIFNLIFKSDNDDFNFLLKSTRFLTLITQVIKDVKKINSEDVVHLNSFIYNYLVSIDQNMVDSYIYRLMFDLGEVINKRTVRRLYGCELGEDLSIFLAISAKSTFNSIINIKRLNFTLATAYPEAITQKKAIEIYSVLFDNVTDLIIGTIFDTDILSSYDQDWVTDEIKLADYNLTVAVLTILESMVPYEITKVLLSINCEYVWSGAKAQSKIKFSNLNPVLFPKITVLRQQLEGEGKIFP